MEELINLISDILQLILPLFIIQVVLIIVAIIDLVKVKETNGPKWIWAIIIIFFNLLGPIIYFILGRRKD